MQWFASCKGCSFEKCKKIPSSLKANDFLVSRHIGPNCIETEEMLKTCNVSSLDQLIQQTIPQSVYDKDAFKYKDIDFPRPTTENQVLSHLKQLADANKQFKSYLGCGFYDTITPPPILRNLIENPGWYTSYTPYQSEISQGRLEALLNYQTMITELTGLAVSNASLLDEASAGAESLFLCWNAHNQKRNKFFVSHNVFPTTIEVIKSRALFLDIEVIVGDIETYDFAKNGKDICGVVVQTPDNLGRLTDFSDFFKKMDSQKIFKVVATDLLSLCLNKTPKEMGADITFGNSQRFGVPLGYGGPHAAFLASVDLHKRKLPGRIIGTSKDVHGDPSLRMALQTREQHIKREKATSNICTAQALLANIAGMYAVYHGPKGLKEIATRVNGLAQILASFLTEFGFKLVSPNNEACTFFDTVSFTFEKPDDLLLNFQQYQINLRKVDEKTVSISIDEATTLTDIYHLVQLFAHYTHQKTELPKPPKVFHDFGKRIKPFSNNLGRTSNYLQQEIFNTIQTETKLMRYLHRLQTKDIALNYSMIPLGSCTMKLNAASEMLPITWPGFNKIHPFVPLEQVPGYIYMINNIIRWLKAITKFDGFSLQPNSGATGEYTGLLAIRRYQMNKGEGHRKICLIPASAHGTNPASAIIAGLKVIVVKTVDGLIDLKHLKELAEKHKNELSALMVTYPSTHGVFEDTVKEAIDIVHKCGGQVYMDGANMNAQVGFTSPGFIGADVCHLNLHKTFAIPHGGGGPGLGPIGVKEHLTPFLPSHNIIQIGGHKDIAISAAPFSSASIIPISYSYIHQLGGDGLKKATQYAILNANYLMNKLKDSYKIVFTGQNGRCAHEFIIDIRPFKDTGIKAGDVAKRLQDFGFHAPTVSFPIPETLMIEPTESEDKVELDRFADALIIIRGEIDKIAKGVYKKDDNPLVNAPHTESHVTADEWKHCYTRQVAAFPAKWIKARGKYWPSIGRNDDAYGDRNFCGSLKNY